MKNTPNVSLSGFIINLLITAALAWLLSVVYHRYGSSLSNRKLFGQNFVVIAMTTMLIITVVQYSIALSLGLVGALSIVRFRAAIKEPEELAYLFLAISVGLGMGANQRMVTLTAFAIILGVILVRNFFEKRNSSNQNLHLTIADTGSDPVTIEDVAGVLSEHCTHVHMVRYDDSSERLEASFFVQLADFTALAGLKKSLRDLSSSVQLTYLDTRGVL